MDSRLLASGFFLYREQRMLGMRRVLVGARSAFEDCNEHNLCLAGEIDRFEIVTNIIDA
jgi:hypothetical protein